MKQKKSGLLIIAIVMITSILLFINSPLSVYTMNRIAVVTSRGFAIPHESSLYDFKVLELNSGSGEWWIYGEDKERYYFAGDGAIPHPYVSIRKVEAVNCPGFEPLSFDTWCTYAVGFQNSSEPDSDPKPEPD